MDVNFSKTDENERWSLKPVNVVLNHFGNGEILITKQGAEFKNLTQKIINLELLSGRKKIGILVVN